MDNFINRATSKASGSAHKALDCVKSEEMRKIINGSMESRRVAAENPNTPVHILEKLAEDKEYTIRFFVAKNPKTPIGALEKLAKDKVPEVRECVPQNPKAPVHILEKLAEDEDAGIRSWLAINPNTPTHVLEKLAEDECIVKIYVAKNPNTPIHVLEKLASDEDDTIKKTAEETLSLKNNDMKLKKSGKKLKGKKPLGGGGAKGLTGEKLGEGAKMFRVKGIKGKVPGRTELPKLKKFGL